MRLCLCLGSVKSPSIRAKVRAEPPEGLTLFSECSDLGIKTDGQAQAASKPEHSELGWQFFCLFSPSPPQTVPPPTPPQTFFPLPHLTFLAWKRRVQVRVAMVRSSTHHFVFCLDHNSKPGVHNCEPTKLPLWTNFCHHSIRKEVGEAPRFFLLFSLTVCFFPVSRPLPVQSPTERDLPIFPPPGPAFRLREFQQKS